MNNTITVELPEKMPNTARVVGPNNRIRQMLDGIDSLKLWDQRLKCWQMPRKRVDDLVAHAQRRRHQVYVIEVDQ